MADILRTWFCLNGRCARTFDAWEANPPCPGCGCVRVSWVPGGGHVAGSGTKTADAELRALADVFKMGDMHSARRGEAAKIVPAQAPASGGAAPIQFAPGFAAAAPPDRAVCVPSTQAVDFKARPPVGAALSPNRSVPAIGSNTRIEARHSTSGGGGRT